MALSYLYCTADDVKKQLMGLDVSDLPDSIIDAITTKYIPWAQRDVDSFCGTNFDLTTTEEWHNGTGSDLLVLSHKPVREILNVVLYIIPSVQWFQFARWAYVNEVDQLGTKVARTGRVNPNTNVAIPPYVFPMGLGFQNEDPDLVDQTATFDQTTTYVEAADLFVNMRLGTLKIPPRILFLESQAVPFWNYTWIRGSQNVRVKYVYGYSNPIAVDTLTGLSTGSLPREITEATAALAAKYILRDKGLVTGSGATSMNIDGVSRAFGTMPYQGYMEQFDQYAHEILKRYRRIGV